MLVTALYAMAVMTQAPAAAEPLGSEADVEDGDIIVYGRQLNRIGLARSASEGTVGYRDFEATPLSRVGELVENVPGMIATQHSGTGKANQFSCAASTSIMAPISPVSSMASRSTCAAMATARVISISTS